MNIDMQIAQASKMEPIVNIAKNLNIPDKYVESYGHYKAKISYEYLKELENKEDAKLILVTAITPTPAGEGKTTTTIALAQGLNKLGKNSIACLREPSLGPCFGIKGGAAGGGYSQVVPMEDINLHFTGDIHAITTAHNLLAALLDNHLQQGNELNIDPRQIVWKRVLDMNDRALRNTVIGLNGKANGVPRENQFQITVASEVMAIMCLANDLEDLKEKLGDIIIAYTYDNKKITAKDLKAHGAMTVLLKEALKPNLVQTLENTPAFIHGGPFANIAHGCNSVLATKTASKLSDIVVTEAGFGADLGAEKFFDIKCRKSGLVPDAVVIVATVRALKYNGGVEKADLGEENLDALGKGIANLEKHIENIKKYKLPTIVSINHFVTDTDKEIAFIEEVCKKHGVESSLCTGWADGGKGAIDLSEKVIKTLEKAEADFEFLYEDSLPVREKIEKIAKDIYGASGVTYSPASEKTLRDVKEQGYEDLAVCIAKTQYSLSDDPAKLGRPENFEIHITDMTISAGAGFVVAIAGSVMTMPGLPKKPAAESIDIDENGKTVGLF